jgi:hypothetical protein
MAQHLVTTQTENQLDTVADALQALGVEIVNKMPTIQVIVVNATEAQVAQARAINGVYSIERSRMNYALDGDTCCGGHCH